MRLALALLVCGCVGSGSAPSLSTVEDRVAVVGEELRIDLDGTDPDGDRLHYSFHAPATLVEIENRTSMSVTPSGAGVFRFTPVAADLGAHAFDFVVSDGTNESVLTINIDVVLSAGAPIFRSPLGTGATLDFAHKDCIELDVVIEDYDTADVTLSQEAPVIAGATLVQRDATHATWKWCPTPAQRAADSRHTLILGADDGTTKTIKNFLVMLREPPAATCTDDSREPDDDATQARATLYPTYSSSANMICKDDDDWYRVPLYAGEVMTVDLTFVQHNASEDLDVHLYKAGVDLTPCDALSPELCSPNGQSADSNEHMTFTAPAACTSVCTYYVVVRGFDGGASPYDITIKVN